MEKADDDSPCTAPSFSTYSGDRLAETAERVGRRYADDEYREKGDVEFEFAVLQTDHEAASSPGLVFPVFDQSLVSREEVLTPLKDLFLRERNDEPPQQTYASSSDDDEEDELDATPSEIYCPWTPARSTAEMSPSGGCRKSKSTGSSSTKRWRIRDLLRRSHSDGKQSLKFLNSSESPKKKEKEKVSAHEKFYLRNKAMKEEDRRKSYLPYKQDLVGLFANINRFGKTFPPF